MRSISLILISIILCAGQATYARPTTRPIHNYPFTPVPFTAVHIDGGFWSPRLETNRKVTIPIAYHQSEATGRIYHFWQAAHPSDTIHPKGLRYDDSDVYKIIEGAAYSLQVHKDRQLEHITDSIIDCLDFRFGDHIKLLGYATTDSFCAQCNLFFRFLTRYIEN